MRLLDLVAVALLATTACQPHLAPVGATTLLTRDGEIAEEAAAVAGSDAAEVVEIGSDEAADAFPVDHCRDEATRPFGRLSSRSRVFTGARDAIRERRRH